MDSTRKRTRPRSAVQQRPDRTNLVLPPLNAPFAGCCKPYPDATFAKQELVALNAHHTGPSCKGYLEPMSLEEWNAEVARRPRPRLESKERGGDDADRGRRDRKRSRSSSRRNRWGDE